jgi:hypothetical protein
MFAGAAAFDTGPAAAASSSSSPAADSVGGSLAQLPPEEQAEILSARKLSYNALMDIAAQSAEQAPAGLPLSGFRRGMPPGLARAYQEAYEERFRERYEQQRRQQR